MLFVSYIFEVMLHYFMYKNVTRIQGGSKACALHCVMPIRADVGKTMWETSVNIVIVL